MRPKQNRRSKKTGLSPGSLIYVGEPYAEAPQTSFIRFDEHSFTEGEIKSAADLSREKDKQGILWINIDGLSNVDLLEDLGRIFGLHLLVLEDILNTEQRPKSESYDDYLYVVLRNFTCKNGDDLSSEQISLILGNNFVLSFNEKANNIFQTVKERLRNNKGPIRKAGADYLIHAMIDNIVDNYFIILENIGEKIESLEEDLVRQTNQVMLHSVYHLKRELLSLRKSLWPLREAISSLQRIDSPLIKSTTVIYFKDIFDHVIALIDSVETYRDTTSGMLEIYLSSVNKKLNEIMKVLAIIATIFMPLTFIAGVYGMNFKYMPELEWPWGYFAVLAIMLAVALSMVRYFKKRKWF